MKSCSSMNNASYNVIKKEVTEFDDDQDINGSDGEAKDQKKDNFNSSMKMSNLGKNKKKDSYKNKKSLISPNKKTKDSTKNNPNPNPNNPSDATKQEFNQKFFNVINKIIKFFDENEVIDTKLKKKNPMTVLNKLKNVSDSSQRNDLLEKLENISNNVIKFNKENSITPY